MLIACISIWRQYLCFFGPLNITIFERYHRQPSLCWTWPRFYGICLIWAVPSPTHLRREKEVFRRNFSVYYSIFLSPSTTFRTFFPVWVCSIPSQYFLGSNIGWLLSLKDSSFHATRSSSSSSHTLPALWHRYRISASKYRWIVGCIFTCHLLI